MSEEFKTGFLPTPEETKALFAAADLPSLPESEWIEISRRAYFQKLGWYAAQLSSSGCTGFSSALSASKVRALNGQPPEKLSGAYLYSLINGGRDDGSNIGNALKALKEHGCCRELVCDIHDNFNYIYRKNTKDFDGDAARFKGEYGFRLPIDPSQAAVAIQRGGIVEFAVYADRDRFGRSKFQTLDSEGVSQMVAGTGNHAVHADGLVKTNKHGWCLDMQTWTKNFGDNGYAKIPLDMLDRIKHQEMWAIFSTIDDPDDSHDPPRPIL